MSKRWIGTDYRSVVKRLLLVATLVALPVIAWAQWTTSSNDIYNSNSGNVGIGTTSPGNTLTVAGSGTPASHGVMQVIYPFGKTDTTERWVASWTSNDGGFSTWKLLLSAIGSSTTANRTFSLGTGTEGVAWDGNLALQANGGNVGIGTTAPAQKLDVRGHIRQSSTGDVDFISVNGNGKTWRTYNFYSNNHLSFWSDAAGGVVVLDLNPNGNVAMAGDLTVSGNISAKYQDIAEWVPASQELKPGTVVIQDSEAINSVIPSNESYDTRVAGVVSSSPGIILGIAGEGKARIATTGRVKVHVDASRASIRAGDLLVTSDKVGTAMRSEPINVSGTRIHRPGTLIGKALEPLSSGEGDILVLLSLQ